MRTVCLSWKGLVQHLSLLQADGKAEVLGCIRENGWRCVVGLSPCGRGGRSLSKQQLSDKFFDGFSACEETPNLKRLPPVRKQM